MKQRLPQHGFPRLSELRREAVDPSPYYFDVDDANQIQAKHVREIESDLQGLDAAAWELFKQDLIPLVKKRHPERGWQALLNKLNEAKGYNYLVRMGCTDVQFIPRSSSRTPDLKGRLGSNTVLCEIKTINPSDDEFKSREDHSVRSIVTQLSIGFFNKLRSTLQTARDQMTTYSQDAGIKKIVYLVVNYDDILHEYAATYSTQLAAFIASTPVPGLDIKLDIKPPYYWATA
jgi:hypothetical protein